VYNQERCGLFLAYVRAAGYHDLWLRLVSLVKIKINYSREFGRYPSAVIDLLVANSRADRFKPTGLIVNTEVGCPYPSPFPSSHFSIFFLSCVVGKKKINGHK
jgi:hypothetical protein